MVVKRAWPRKFVFFPPQFFQAGDATGNDGYISKLENGSVF